MLLKKWRGFLIVMACKYTVFNAASEIWLPMVCLAKFLLTSSLCDPYYTQKVYKFDVILTVHRR